MTETMWIRSHLERLLQDEWNVCRVIADDDGDYPFRRGTAACWVSVIDAGDRPMVRIFSHAALGIRPTLKVYRELNEIQRRCVSTAVALESGIVIVSQTISPIGLSQVVLAQAMDAVANVSNDIGLLIAGMFSGSTPFDPEPIDHDHDEEAA